MPRYLNTTGNATLGIAICARCQFKFALGELMPDPNIPGLLVCEKDRDNFDPYRMATRMPDKVTLPFVRPDVALTQPASIDWEDEP